ncbi:leucine-rich repeat-containing protein 9 isoform X2 [Takifugu flavidus]|uniref:leucine-rich repeat-containing protein 9 isoform X2 n=1 Tax=Takifugu flavidus TaxID=433684 RepID=UPI002544B576|nr:leucine-rich repeat-containing protein 9 isoform X2 [Takifugu flavidus]
MESSVTNNEAGNKDGVDKEKSNEVPECFKYCLPQLSACGENGSSYNTFTQDRSSIYTLEVFFSGFAHMVGLSFFPNLRHLTIVGQELTKIEALEGCPLLEELWVAECRLTEISGLDKCLQLKKLYLYDNQISEINNVEFLINLDVLWLNSNSISRIQGLNRLQNLLELNLADNKIEKIGQSLGPNTNLQNLNLSGNKISSIKDLTKLAHLPQLRELMLNDPTTTPNPVCLLHNYATHVLYHMPQLQHLDTHDISSTEVKDTAESIVMKKMMYYNMRVQTAQRKLREMRLSLLERKKIMLEPPEESLMRINHCLKSLEHELSKVSSACEMKDGTVEDSVQSRDPTHPSPDPSIKQKIISKMEALKKRQAYWTRRLVEIDAWFKKNLAQAAHMTDYTVQFLLMELESVGNIRLEEGCPADRWFTSCCDLLLSRFRQLDFEVHSISGIKVNRVIRISNSALRLRFEDKFDSLRTSNDGSVQYNRCQLEHLFYLSDPEKDEKREILGIIEEGFQRVEEREASQGEGFIPFSNSLFLTEQPRIAHALTQACKADSECNIDPIPFRHSQVIVSKVFVGQSVPLVVGSPLDQSHYPNAYSVYQNVENRFRTGGREEGTCSSPTHTVPECSLGQRRWFVFDPELVLPEYIIFFEYVFEVRCKTELPDLSRHREGAPSGSSVLDGEVLNMEPVLKPQPKLLSLDNNLLLNVARANFLSQITMLNLHGHSLNKIKAVSSLTALRHLNISFNAFTRLDDISHMPNLEFLDASYNHLITLEGLRDLERLKHLDVSWNKLTKSREEAAVLRKHTPMLLKLDTRHNPWKKPKSVRLTLLGYLKTLTHLDGVTVAEEEAAEAVQMVAGSKINQASLLSHSRTNSERPHRLSLLPTAQLLCLLNPPPWGLTQDLEPDWTAKITTLDFNSQGIYKLTNLSGLVNLRWASFNDNDLSKVEGLESCVKMEELSLNNNNISTLSGLSKLQRLKKLSLNGNQLTSLDSSVLDQLPQLCFLSVEDNSIASLHGIRRARSLLEFYICNNCISMSKDIYCLKELANLIILDLSGNPVEKVENYRNYVLFHLPELKALDGAAVEAPECESAKEMFGGRLIPDVLTERLGLTNCANITCLTLQSFSIRVVDLNPPELFSSLHTVRLDHNNLTSFSGLVHLPHIRDLSLNYNHIESVLPKQKIPNLTNKQILYNKVHSSGYGKQRSLKGKGEPGQSCGLEPLMDSLEVLHLSHNGISNMANLELSRLTSLKALFLEGNEIRHVDGLEGLHKLRELVLDKNRIKALAEDSFISQNSLLELHLSENRIQDLGHLGQLSELRKLFLDSNRVQDFTELEKLQFLTSLSQLSLIDNPVDSSSLYRPSVLLRLPLLKVLDGERVTLEDRARVELLNVEETCYNCSGPCPNASELTLTGLPPVVSQPTGLIDKSGGFQDTRHGLFIQHHNVDEAQSLTISKYRKHKQVSNTQGGQKDMSFRHIRRTAATGLSHCDKEIPSRLTAMKKAADFQIVSNLFPCSSQKK